MSRFWNYFLTFLAILFLLGFWLVFVGWPWWVWPESLFAFCWFAVWYVLTVVACVVAFVSWVDDLFEPKYRDLCERRRRAGLPLIGECERFEDEF